MVHIRTNSNGTFRADIRMKGASINKTFPSSSLAEQCAAEIEFNINSIRALSKAEVKLLTLDQVEMLGGIDLFNRLRVRLDLIQFNDLVGEYVKQWTGKDSSMLWRLKFWTDIFGSEPIKSIQSSEIKQVLRDYGAGRNPESYAKRRVRHCAEDEAFIKWFDGSVVSNGKVEECYFW